MYNIPLALFFASLSYTLVIYCCLHAKICIMYSLWCVLRCNQNLTHLILSYTCHLLVSSCAKICTTYILCAYRGNQNLTHFGPLASGIPGFVAGTWELKKRLGNPDISWSRLIFWPHSFRIDMFNISYSFLNLINFLSQNLVVLSCEKGYIFQPQIIINWEQLFKWKPSNRL